MYTEVSKTAVQPFRTVPQGVHKVFERFKINAKVHASSLCGFNSLQNRSTQEVLFMCCLVWCAHHKLLQSGMWWILEFLFFHMFSTLSVLMLSFAYLILYFIWNIDFICRGWCISILSSLPPPNSDDRLQFGHSIHPFCFFKAQTNSYWKYGVLTGIKINFLLLYFSQSSCFSRTSG